MRIVPLLLLALLFALTACVVQKADLNESLNLSGDEALVNGKGENITEEPEPNISILNESNETAADESVVVRNVSLIEGEGVLVDRVSVFFEETLERRALFQFGKRARMMSENESIVVDGLNITLTAIEKDGAEKEVGSEVSFWLGGIRDTLEEGEGKQYGPYNVSVLLIGEGDFGLGEALFRVNGETVGPLAEDETDYFGEKQFVMVREVFYRRSVKKIKQDRVNLTVRRI